MTHPRVGVYLRHTCNSGAGTAAGIALSQSRLTMKPTNKIVAPLR
jgi:hypothetical protein